MPNELLQRVDYAPYEAASQPDAVATAGGLLDQIRSRCYWLAVIRPERFIPNRIENYSRLRPIVLESAVSLNGWLFPQVNDWPETRRGGDDWVGEELDVHEHLEYWRLYQSGQFVSIRGLWHDWKGRSIQNPDGDGPTNELPLWHTIRRLQEIYEFAARLALTEAGDDMMRVEVKIGNLHGRLLVQDDRRMTPLYRYVYPANSFSHPERDSDPIPREALITQAREFAAVVLHELFRRFGFALTKETIRSLQDEAVRK